MACCGVRHRCNSIRVALPDIPSPRVDDETLRSTGSYLSRGQTALHDAKQHACRLAGHRRKCGLGGNQAQKALLRAPIATRQPLRPHHRSAQNRGSRDCSACRSRLHRDGLSNRRRLRRDGLPGRRRAHCTAEPPGFVHHLSPPDTQNGGFDELRSGMGFAGIVRPGLEPEHRLSFYPLLSGEFVLCSTCFGVVSASRDSQPDVA